MLFLATTGGRYYHDHEGLVGRALQRAVDRHQGPIVILEGGCPTGLDGLVRNWVESRTTASQTLKRVRLWTADAAWSAFGNSAGPRRNRFMASVTRVALMEDYEAFCLAFPGGKGTASCVAEMKKKRVRVYDGEAYAQGRFVVL